MLPSDILTRRYHTVLVRDWCLTLTSKNRRKRNKGRMERQGDLGDIGMELIYMQKVWKRCEQTIMASTRKCYKFSRGMNATRPATRCGGGMSAETGV